MLQASVTDLVDRVPAGICVLRSGSPADAAGPTLMIANEQDLQKKCLHAKSMHDDLAATTFVFLT